SVINAVAVAESLIATGRYGTVLVACGEAPSRAVRWDVPDRATYLLSAPGYTMSDAGAAVLVRRATPAEADARDASGTPAPRGILASAFGAESTHWDVDMLPGGGTAHPRDLERTYFEIGGARPRRSPPRATPPGRPRAAASSRARSAPCPRTGTSACSPAAAPPTRATSSVPTSRSTARACGTRSSRSAPASSSTRSDSRA